MNDLSHSFKLIAFRVEPNERLKNWKNYSNLKKMNEICSTWAFWFISFFPVIEPVNPNCTLFSFDPIVSDYNQSLFETKMIKHLEKKKYRFPVRTITKPLNLSPPLRSLFPFHEAPPTPLKTSPLFKRTTNPSFLYDSAPFMTYTSQCLSHFSVWLVFKTNTHHYFEWIVLFIIQS